LNSRFERSREARNTNARAILTFIKAIFARSHASSFEALYNHKVDGGELNSEQLESGKQRGHYKDGDLVFLWKSDPIRPTRSGFAAICRCVQEAVERGAA